MTFDWRALGEAIAKLGLPLLGGALGGPGGAAIGAGLASAIGSSSAAPQDILAAIQANADALAKAKQFEAEQRTTLLKLTLEADTARIESVNATLRADAQSGSWLAQNHHALECLAAVGLVIAEYVGLPLAHIAPPSVPAEAWMMLGAVLGVTAWHQGAAAVESAKQ